MHLPASVHGSPSSSQVAPSSSVAVQPLAGSQTSLVQALPSSQVPVPLTQTPFLHESPTVQGLPSASQSPAFSLLYEQPAAPAQASMVQGLSSSQVPSSVSPSQSLSTPSQVSKPGVGALQSVSPVLPQVRWPLQVASTLPSLPLSTLVQVVDRDWLTAILEHLQAPTPLPEGDRGAQTLAVLPSTVGRSVQPCPVGHSASLEHLGPQKAPALPCCTQAASLPTLVVHGYDSVHGLQMKPQVGAQKLSMSAPGPDHKKHEYPSCAQFSMHFARQSLPSEVSAHRPP